MFSQFVTAAKGLFARQESEDTTADPADTNASTTPKMVTATRQRVVQPELPSEEPVTNGVAVAKGGKRKAQGTSTVKPDTKQSKRRKRDSLEATEAINDDAAIDTLEQTDKKGKKNLQVPESAPKNHFRFGSEEPVMPEEPLPQATPEVSNNDEEDDSDDDDAPEAIDNSAQLLKMKEQAKRQARTKQLYVSFPPSRQCFTSAIF